MENRLRVTQVENNQKPQAMKFSRAGRRHEVEATMERLWLDDPEQFNPERDAVQRKRVFNTIEAIKKQMPLEHKKCVDLGCGSGVISRLLRDGGAKIDAVDAAANALNRLKTHDIHNIRTVQDCLPSTRLDDNAYDLVVCTEMIGYLNSNEYRLLFAELSRLIKKEGTVACSSSLDIDTENALERFAAFAETEFEIDQWVLRHDLLWIRFCSFFEAPARYIKSSQDPREREKQLAKRKATGKMWFRINSTKPLAVFWRLVNLAAKPMTSRLKQSDAAVNFLEKITKFLWDESGISHALFLGKRRPMAFPLPQNELPVELKHKREVWD